MHILLIWAGFGAKSWLLWIKTPFRLWFIFSDVFCIKKVSPTHTETHQRDFEFRTSNKVSIRSAASCQSKFFYTYYPVAFTLFVTVTTTQSVRYNLLSNFFKYYATRLSMTRLVSVPKCLWNALKCVIQVTIGVIKPFRRAENGQLNFQLFLIREIQSDWNERRARTFGLVCLEWETSGQQLWRFPAVFRSG